MEKFLETSGKTIDAAIEAALSALGLDRDQVSVEVLEKPKSGFLGLGGTQARVRVSYSVSRAGKVETFLKGLLERMHASAEPVVAEQPDGSLSVELIGSDLGFLIGHRGDTLDAIQHLANYAVNRGEEQSARVDVDAEHYRAKRLDALRRLAQKTGEKVVKYRRSLTLEPMNAYERHVIHTALQELDGVSTHSVGVDPNRRVVVSVILAPGERPAPSLRAEGSPARGPRPGGSSRPSGGFRPSGGPRPEGGRPQPQPRSQPRPPTPRVEDRPPNADGYRPGDALRSSEGDDRDRRGGDRDRRGGQQGGGNYPFRNGNRAGGPPRSAPGQTPITRPTAPPDPNAPPPYTRIPRSEDS